MNKINTSDISHLNNNFLEIDKRDVNEKVREKKISLRKENFMQKIFRKRLNLKDKNNYNSQNEVILRDLKISDPQKDFEIKFLVRIFFNIKLLLLKDREIIEVLLNLLNSEFIDYQKLAVLKIREYLNGGLEDKNEILFDNILLQKLIQVLIVSSDKSIWVIQIFIYCVNKKIFSMRFTGFLLILQVEKMSIQMNLIQIICLI